ncbi:hypothetical protein MCUN1_000484 [Malassezia cuniculi]|uniref:Ribosomal protein/NADH dehydrogenase domain-containing protein n=1 Tax=Malassezia cuniculi TaxID=948313 RepID=A0AAF0ESN5_9BASI|nr:hypothetical protein MCUN1_000484 [Malassezia cuniculi]
MASVLSKAFPAALKEVRLHLSPIGSMSAGARQFLQSNYATIKQNNPNVPFLVREAQDTPARVFVRFDRGVEKHAELDGLDNTEITKKITELLS